jgi:hypothetical protein
VAGDNRIRNGAKKDDSDEAVFKCATQCDTKNRFLGKERPKLSVMM